jgi:Family of unknown function (DUF6356)
MLRTSRQHLIAAGETYWQHMQFAGAVGLMAIGAGLACLIHALIPALCQRTCSQTIALLQQLFRDRDSLPEVTAQASGAMIFAALIGMSAFAGIVPVAAGASAWFGLVVFTLAFAIPATFLISNPELSPVESSD